MMFLKQLPKNLPIIYDLYRLRQISHPASRSLLILNLVNDGELRGVCAKKFAVG